MNKRFNFKLTRREIYLALVFAVIGFFLTLRGFVGWLDVLTPLAGLVVYYVLLYSAIYVLSKFGLVIFGLRIEKPLQIIGLGLITFAFFMIVNWESEYVNLVTVGTSTGVSQAYWASEDGAVWYLWYHVVGVKDIEIARLLTFVLTPFLLALGGGFLLERKISLTDTHWWKFWGNAKRK
jgi:hypothetical protein